MRFIKFAFLGFITAISLINISFSQNQNYSSCEGKVVPIRAYIKGFEYADSLSITDIIRSGKLQSASKAFEIESFHCAFGGDCSINGLPSEMHCDSNQLSNYNKTILTKLTNRNEYLYIDCIKAKNKIGEVYLLQAFRCKLIWKK